jgi:peptidoglycan/LPS O-acetylase OafA/YrhL
MRDIAGPEADLTAAGKTHFEVLDGMRGSAAILVVLFHIMGMPIAWSDQGQLLHHAALAVDFFFALSGFVVAYAYDDRWATMSTRQFIAIRLVRLHPLVLLGAVLGLISFLADPFAANQKAVPLATVLADFALACLLLPHPELPNRWTDTHSINSPAWSLLQEYIGNLVYALALRRLGTRLLGIVVTLAGLGLVVMALTQNSIDQGSDWGSMPLGSVRMGFSFTLGLWLYRVRDRFPRFRLGWLAASAILVVLFALPLVPKSIPHGNGAYEAVLVVLVFPLLILSGAHSDIGRAEMSLCKLAGRLSYPVYILHYPFLLIYMNFVVFETPPAATARLAAAAAFLIVMGFAWLALRFYDEPLRRRLKAAIRPTSPPR